MKTRTVYTCQNCAHQERKWLGRCPSCDAWGSLVEEVVRAPKKGAASPAPARGGQLVPISQVTYDQSARSQTGIAELDRVLGGGLVRGALVLVGGDPGIGKSTLLLQAMGAIASQGAKVLYLSAEESLQQIKVRADRLGVSSDNLYLFAETSLEYLDNARRELKPDVMVIDSIQTVAMPGVETAVGSVGQIRAVTHHLMDVAKGQGVSTFVVGHVTKEGAIAGPKVMEHMVDTVLYFEGERTGSYRVLRAHKNRFGSAQEIGVFEMRGDGLAPVSNPSELFLSQRSEGPGAAVVTSLEGSRPILLEVQALATPSIYGTPRRTTIGFDQQRVAMLCAVLEARAGLQLSGYDIYVNVAGGVRVSEPAADLGVLLALASTVSGRAVDSDVLVVGEVGLSGEVRGVTQLGARLKEAAALGFKRCIVPKVDLDRWTGEAPVLRVDGVSTVSDALEAAGLNFTSS